MSAAQGSPVASGQRVALRPLAEGDATALMAWLPAAVALGQGRRAPVAQDEAAARHLLAFQSSVVATFRSPKRRQPHPWRPEGSRCVPPIAQRLVVVQRGSDVPIGLACLCPGQPEAGWATIRYLAMAPEQRGRGLGGEAVLAFEKAAMRQGWGQRFCAAVHPDNGLSLYFWLRMGYRPALPSEFAPGQATGGCQWMVR